MVFWLKVSSQFLTLSISFKKRKEKDKKGLQNVLPHHSRAWIQNFIGNRGLKGLQLTRFCRCRSINSYTFLFACHTSKNSQMMLCICKPISVVMPFLYNASNFMFPTDRLQSVITVCPDAVTQSSGLLLYLNDFQ